MRMRPALTAICLFGLLVALSPPAHAQRFFEVIPPWKLRPDDPQALPEARRKNQVGLYASFWKIPSEVRLQRTVGSGQVRFEGDADTSAMLAAEIPIARQWSAGGWFNSVSGDGILNTGLREIPTQFDDDLLDLHLTYYTRGELALQLGFLREKVSAEFEGQSRKETTYSLNAWALKTFGLGRARNGGRRWTVTAGLGYTGGDEPAANALGGVTTRLTPLIEAHLFAWVFDVEDPVYRYTVGLAARF